MVKVQDVVFGRGWLVGIAYVRVNFGKDCVMTGALTVLACVTFMVGCGCCTTIIGGVGVAPFALFRWRTLGKECTLVGSIEIAGAGFRIGSGTSASAVEVVVIGVVEATEFTTSVRLTTSIAVGELSTQSLILRVPSATPAPLRRDKNSWKSAFVSERSSVSSNSTRCASASCLRFSSWSNSNSNSCFCLASRIATSFCLAISSRLCLETGMSLSNFSEIWRDWREVDSFHGWFK